MTESIDRIEASSAVKQLINFRNGLNNEQKNYLDAGLAGAIIEWLDGSSMFRGAESLRLMGGVNHPTNRLAISLLHLKKIFPVRVPDKLYRLTSIPRLPRTPTVKVSARQQLKPLLSFTALKNPKVYDREKTNHPDIVLEWKPIEKYVIASHRSLDRLADAMLDMIAMTHAADMSNKLHSRRLWSEVKGVLRLMYPEQEYLVYLQPGVSLVCKWRLQ